MSEPRSRESLRSSSQRFTGAHRHGLLDPFIEPLTTLFIEYLVDRRDAAPLLIYKYRITGIQQNELSGDLLPQIPRITRMNHSSPNFKEPAGVLTPNGAYTSPGYTRPTFQKASRSHPKLGKSTFRLSETGHVPIQLCYQRGSGKSAGLMVEVHLSKELEKIKMLMRVQRDKTRGTKLSRRTIIVFPEDTIDKEGFAKKPQATITPTMNFWVRVSQGFRHHFRSSFGLNKQTRSSRYFQGSHIST